MIETGLRELTESVVREKVGGTKGANNVLQRLALAEADCVADLLNGVPTEGGSASRAMLQKVIATAFQSGAIHATKFVDQADF
jgi:hypothetical protein